MTIKQWRKQKMEKTARRHQAFSALNVICCLFVINLWQLVGFVGVCNSKQIKLL